MFLKNEPTLNLQLKRKIYQEEEYLDFYQKGEEISLFGFGFCQVYRGVIQLNRLNSKQREVVMGWITPNHAYGSMVDKSCSYCAIALSDVYLRKYQPQEIAQSTQLARQLLSEMSYRLIKSAQMVEIVSHKKVEDRLRGLLLMLKEEMGHPIDRGIRLTARFTHQNIADALCTTRVTVTRILGDLQDQNLIEFDNERHLIVKF